MEEIDNDGMMNENPDDDELFLRHVAQDDHELLYLHSYFEELLSSRAG